MRALLNPDNLSGSSLSLCENVAAIFAACSVSIDLLWTSPNQKNCLAGGCTIISRPNGLLPWSDKLDE